MITAPQTDTLQHAVVQGVAHEGITVRTRDGRRARLAIIDDEGRIVESGRTVEREVFAVATTVLHNYWRGQGHMRVLSSGAVEVDAKAVGR